MSKEIAAARLEPYLEPDEIVVLLKKMPDGLVDFSVVASNKALEGDAEKNLRALYYIATGMITYASTMGKATELYNIGVKVLTAMKDMEEAKTVDASTNAV